MVEQKDYVSYSVLINGIEVNAVYSRDSIDGIFRPLLRRLTRMQKDKNRRILAFFAAPPGAGKSTLLSFLEMSSPVRYRSSVWTGSTGGRLISSPIP